MKLPFQLDTGLIFLTNVFMILILGRIWQRFADIDRRLLELRQDMDRRFMELRQDMDHRFGEVRQDIAELRKDINDVIRRIDRSSYVPKE